MSNKGGNQLNYTESESRPASPPNEVYCQGKGETRGIVSRAAGLLSKDGILVIHDFFRDRGELGGLYGLHMMLNTYNGKVYTTAGIRAMTEEAGLAFAGEISLPSGSCVLLAGATRSKLPLNKISG